MRPLKLSMKAFWIGLPGAMKCQSMALSLHQASMALQVNSVPLSETIEPGLPRRARIIVLGRVIRDIARKIDGDHGLEASFALIVSSRATRRPEIATYRQQVFQEFRRVLAHRKMPDALHNGDFAASDAAGNAERFRLDLRDPL